MTYVPSLFLKSTALFSFLFQPSHIGGRWGRGDISYKHSWCLFYPFQYQFSTMAAKRLLQFKLCEFGVNHA